MRNKKIISLLLVLVMVFSLLPAGAWAERDTSDLPEFSTDANTETQKSFKISSAGSLQALAAAVKNDNGSGTYNMSGISFYLANNIDLSGIDNWTPIGNVTYPADAFAGVFDGNGHTVKGLKIDTSAANQGLFGMINGATVENLNVQGSVKASKAYVGGVVGKVQSGTVKNSSFSGNVSSTISSSAYAGGIVGGTQNASTIQGCSNTGTITGYAGGILGYGKAAITNCYNAGEIKGSTRAGGIIGQFNGTATGNTAENCYNIGNISLSSDGYAGGISGYNGYLTNCYWTAPENGTGNSTGSLSNCEKISSSDNLLSKLGSAYVADTGNVNNGYPILAWQAGKTIEKTPVSAVSIEGTARSGMVLTAKVMGDAETYQWLRGDSRDGSFVPADGAASSKLTLTDADIGKYLRIAVTGSKDSSVTATAGPVLPSEAGTVAADKAALASLPAFLVSDTPLDLPEQGENGSVITWSSSNPAVLSNSGTVTLPAADIVTVTLTATIRCGGASDTRDFSIRVYSKAAAEAEKNDPSVYLANAVASLKWYHLSPVYGKDTNAVNVLKAALAAQGYGELDVSVKSVENPADNVAAIAQNGDITYFYADPSGFRGMWFSQIPVTFTLTKGEETTDYSVNAVIGWDAAKVKAYLSQNIVTRLTLPDEAVSGMTLPHYIYTGTSDTPDYSDYTKFIAWAPVTWASSDANALEVGNNGAYYAPFATTVRPTTDVQSVTLAATITFNRTQADLDAPITVDKVFTVTIPPMSADERDAAQKKLAEKLDAGLAKAGLSDAVTGEKLTQADGVYTASNDIQFPTTRDFGVDGKYFPVSIKSSDTDVIVPFDVNNAARVTVYRPLPGHSAQNVTLTLTITDKASGISAAKEIKVCVQPLTQQEIDAEIALMEQVKAHYFDGIKNGNSSADSITSDLHAFQEAYLKDGALTWVYDRTNLVNHGIVPEAMNGWEELEQWRCFRSSNPAVISNENLLVTREKENKTVTVTSCLSSEVYGKYAIKYPNSKDFQKLYYQPIRADLVVAGTAPTSTAPVVQTLTVSLTLQSADSTWLPKITASGFAEGSTVFDVFNQVLKQNGYGFAARGSYVYAVTNPSGTTLQEFDDGKDSGWLYKVNGVLPSVYMAACPLHDGDDIVVFFTKDYTEETGHMGDGGGTTPSGGSKIEQKTVITGNTATVAISEASIANAIAAIQKSGEKTITVVPTNTGSAANISITIPKTAAKSVVDATKAGIKVETGSGTVTIPNEALAAIVKQAFGDDVKISVEKKTAADVPDKTIDTKNAVIATITVASNGKAITTFGGERLTVGIPVDSGYTAGQSYKVIILSADGTKDTAAGTCVLKDGKLAVEVGTTHLSTFIVTKEKVLSHTFADVSANAWYRDAVDYATAKGLFSGYSDTVFGPEDAMTRAMLVTVLYRMEGGPAVTGASAFADVQAGQWYTDAIVWAAANKLVDGYGSGLFGTDDSITREQMATILYRYAAYKKYDTAQAGEAAKAFSDYASISGFASQAMDWAVKAKLLQGSENRLMPQGPATRAQAAAILMRFCGSSAK